MSMHLLASKVVFEEKYTLLRERHLESKLTYQPLKPLEFLWSLKQPPPSPPV